jgi:hypothetical protein
MNQSTFRKYYSSFLESRIKGKNAIYFQPRGLSRTGGCGITIDDIYFYQLLRLMDSYFQLIPPLFNDENKSIAENLQMYNRFKIMLAIKEKMNNDN